MTKTSTQSDGPHLHRFRFFDSVVVQKQHALRTVLRIGMWVFAPASDTRSCAEAGQPRGHTAVPSVTLGTVFGQLQSCSTLSHKTGRVRVHTQLEANEVFSAAEGRPAGLRCAEGWLC